MRRIGKAQIGEIEVREKKAESSFRLGCLRLSPVGQFL